MGQDKKSIFSDIKESITGTTQDFTEGRLSRAILFLAGNGNLKKSDPVNKSPAYFVEDIPITN